jgi:HD-GYP domain-containing protein (c-di-GMP phosphodiesterase class II)
MATELLLQIPAGKSARVDLVDVQVAELIIGRPLASPVFDSHGVLLLAGGNVITAEFKRLLEQRGTGSVRVTAEDAERVRFVAPESAGEDALAIDAHIVSQLDRMIDTGLLFVQNSGPAVKESVVRHGRKAYDAQRCQELAEQRTTTSAAICSLMKDAVHGKSVSSTAVTQMAVQYLAAATADTDCVISVAMDATKEPALADHCLKMATLGMAIGVEMGLDADNCKRVFIAGLIHDWGMSRVPAEIRNAPRVLTEHEFFQIRKHPIHTAEMLERMPGIPSVVPVVVYQVHERPNGQGYPRGRAGDRIHLFARILAVADVYAALTEGRPYRQPLAPYSAMECLIRLAKTREVDPEVVRAFLKVMTLFPIGSYVALDDGSVARVLRRNGDRYTAPIVQVVQDSRGKVVTAERQNLDQVWSAATRPVVQVVQDGQGHAVAPHGDSHIIDLAQGTRSILQALPTPGRAETLLSESVLSPVRPRG